MVGADIYDAREVSDWAAAANQRVGFGVSFKKRGGCREKTEIMRQEGGGSARDAACRVRLM